MPEGHTLHRLARLHQRRYVGSMVAVSSPQGRFAVESSLLDGTVLENATAYGKHLFHAHGDAGTVHVHLGLYGAFRESALPVSEPTGQVRMRMVGATHWTDLRGPARCELLTDGEVAAITGRLGPDPLRTDALPERAWQSISSSRTALAALLLDQSVLAGVGNVYRAEVLFRHGVPPLLPGNELDRSVWNDIWQDLVALMSAGAGSGRIDTVRDLHAPEATGRPPRDDRHGGEVYVYRRSGMPCLICGTAVAHRRFANRELYWCPTCQAG